MRGRVTNTKYAKANRPCYELFYFNCLSLSRRTFQVNVNGTLSQIAEAISVVPQGSVIGPVLFFIYVNDLPDRLSADSPLYAHDIKIIAPQNRNDILQNSLNISASWLRDWKLDPNLTKRKHLPIGYSHHFVTYTLPTNNPPNTQIIPTTTTTTTTKDLVIVLNTRLSAENNVVSAESVPELALFPRYLNF